MKNHCFEIKVALLGNVSAGKTTVLNALLGDKFGEVAMKRTTTCANYFRVHTKSTSEQEWPIPPENPRSSESTCKEIIQDNQVKVTKGQTVSEKFFDIELDEPLIPCRPDTRIVVVDLPGINEAGTDNEYKQYVSSKWITYDCVVIVMDGKQGVNTDEQVFVLNFVKHNMKYKTVPVIVLFNKVDEPDDKEQTELLNEAEKEFSKIFSSFYNITFLRISALHAYIYQSGSLMTKEQFMKFDESLIEKIGRDHLGRKQWRQLSYDEKITKAFNILKDQESIKDELQLSNFSPFLSALKKNLGGEDNQKKIIEKQILTIQGAMSYCTTTEIIEKMKFCYKSIKHFFDPSEVDKRLHDLDYAFWAAYKNYENHVFNQLREKWPELNVHLLAGTIVEIAKYFEHVVENDLYEKIEIVREIAKSIVLRLIYFAAEMNSKEKLTESLKACLTYNGESDSGSSLLSPMDWYLIWSSILLPSSFANFCTRLGKEKILLERFQKDAYSLIGRRYNDQKCPCCFEKTEKQEMFDKPPCYSCNKCHIWYVHKDLQFDTCLSNCMGYPPNHRRWNKLDALKKCNKCSFHLVSNHHTMHEWYETEYKEDGTIVPLYPDRYKKFVHVTVPDSLDDPHHFGHLPYKFCQLMDRIDVVLSDAQKQQKNRYSSKDNNFVNTGAGGFSF